MHFRQYAWQRHKAWLIGNVVPMVFYLFFNGINLLNTRLHGLCIPPPREGMGFVLLLMIFAVIYGLSSLMMALLGLLSGGPTTAEGFRKGLSVWGMTSVLWYFVFAAGAWLIQAGYCPQPADTSPVMVIRPGA